MQRAMQEAIAWPPSKYFNKDWEPAPPLKIHGAQYNWLLLHMLLGYDADVPPTQTIHIFNK